MYCTKGPNRVESPATIRYKPSHPQVSLPQAPSSRRCPTPHWSLPSNTSRRDPLRAAGDNQETTQDLLSGSNRRDERPTTAFLPVVWRRCRSQMGPPWAAERHCCEPSRVSRDDASNKGTTPKGAAIACPVSGQGFHPETSCDRKRLRK
jgi:hypothetical protein